MGLWDAVSRFLAIETMQEPPPQVRSIATFDPYSDLATQLAAIQSRSARPWRLPSITEALGVPAIQRAVTLISNTVGSLSLEAFRNGERMDETPRVAVRPDPFTTPRDFYRDAAYSLATCGETILWISTRDGDDIPSSLILVPPAELTVEANTANRLLPLYTWGTKKSTRYSPANPSGEFVHIMYLHEPMALRGVGPLQLAGAAASVSVEAQEWAANLYAGGGNPSINLHSEIELDGDESAALRNQWIATPSNMPQVTSGPLELREVPINPQGAQMLEAREYQNGDAARMFGIPGSLLEYARPGSSLTYQNLAEVWTSFVRGCLAPNYLEPIEQAFADLLPRPIIVRFSVAGLQRADEKTRYEVYATGIESGVLTPQIAQQREGIIPGDVENAPVPAAPPAAIPAPLQQRTTAGPVRCGKCHRLLAEWAAAPYRFTCTNTKCRSVTAADAVEAIETRADDSMLRDIIAVMRDQVAATSELARREQPPAVVTFAEGSFQMAAPVVTVTTPIAEGAVQVNVPAQPVTINLAEPEPVEQRVEYDEQGRVVGLLRVVAPEEGAA